VCREKRMLFSDERTHNQERWASARRGCRYRTCNDASTNSRQTADGACADRRCSRGSEPTGGLRPPLLYCGANVCRRKNDFSDARTHVHKSGGRQPAVGVRQTQLQHRYRTRSEALVTCGNKSGGREPAVGIGIALGAVRSECCSATSEHTTKIGGRQPAVGIGNALAKALPQSRGRLLSVCSQALVPSRQRTHGGLTPPALVA
jgi:hypothetical protein